MKTKSAVAMLAALAQETRLDVFRRLVRAGPDGLTPGDLGDRLGVPAPTLSFHLSQLKAAGLVRARRVGRQLFYAPDFARVEGLVGFLTEECCAEAGCAPAAKSKETTS